MPPAARVAELRLDEKFRARDAARRAGSPLLRTTHAVYLGDAAEMTELGSEPRVHLVVTSPPYWTLQKYHGNAGGRQLGHVDDYEKFQYELARVWKRCFQLLHPGGRLCVVVGDVCISRRAAGRHYVVPLHADIALRCGQIGFDYLTPIIWYKIANAKTEVAGNGSPFLGKPYEPNAIIKNDCEYILMFRKPGAYRNPSSDQRALSMIDKRDHAKWFRAIWADIPGASRARGHPAPFPRELPYRLIRMFSFVGDTVLDPFLGLGTTTDAAIHANRSSIGYEIEPKYFSMTRGRFEQLSTDETVQFYR